MFGSTSAFGQSSTSPFGSQSVFGQNNNANNPFAPKPFGSTSPFGSQSGGSIFGGTSTGVFGATQSSSPLASTPAFGASSTPAFGSSGFGTSSTPGFGSGNSVFGQKPTTTFGGFGSTPSQPTAFGNSFQQTQPAFGNNSAFGSSFGTSSQPAFGNTSTSGFGMTGTPAFGATSTPAFGSTSGAFGATSTPAFGASSGAFGATNTPAFGSTSGAFGGTSTPAFGSTSTPAFGSSSTPGFGSTNTAFPASNAPAFGSGGAFGAPTTPGFGSSTSSAFGATSTGFGSSSSPFGSTNTGFGAPSSPSFGFTSTPNFGQGGSPFGTTPSPFGAQNSPFGSQATTPTFGSTGFGQPSFGGQRGGSRVTGYVPTTEVDGGSTAAKLESISAMPAYKDKSHEELRWEDYQLNDKGGPNPAVQPAGGFGVPATQSNPFGGSSTIGQTPANPFPSNTSSNIFNAKHPPLSTAPSMGQPGSIFGQTGSAFGQNTSSNSQSNPFGLQQPGGNLFNNGSSSSLLTSSNQHSTNPFQMTPPAQTAPSFNYNPFGQSQTTPSGYGTMLGTLGQGTLGQSQSAVVMQPTPVSNPFGTLPAMPQMSIGRSGSTPSIQYGISSMPVKDKPAPVRVSSLLTSRHLSQRRISFPARKYHPKNDGPKVPYFVCDDEEAPGTPKADAHFIPRENPRALVIRPNEKWFSRVGMEKPSLLKDAHDPHRNEGLADENGSDKEHTNLDKVNQRSNGVQEDNSTHKADSYITLSGHRAGEAAIVYEHGADIEALMPKLKHDDYYTEPRIQELAAKERAEPGFCQHVKDFVVGRAGYGSIKFTGETDVRRLDLEFLIQFNNREVIVYMDDSKKPPVGQGLNKPAEVTLLNIKCFDKKTGQQYTEGPKVEKYKQMLMKKARDQGAEFVSYDPIKGEWRFRVNHFSRYCLWDEEEEAGGHSS
ncbi:hypothetical protein IFM89_023767 [Coptis chinensis]|uniref:Nucleoporin autopeptidase n=1 Tax=Coptis chinensis TaxID=261450 RepID=A0A835LF10_9MAGN|nr:hypothetical protein IFM89_023767 [Coptis chinensis]